MAYVVRETVEVTPAREDAATNYDTIQDEMIARAPHQDEDENPLPTYHADNRLVWEKISVFTRNEPCWSYVKPA